MLLRTLLISFACFLSLACFAGEKIIAVVSSVKGKAFYTYEGKTKAIYSGMHLPRQAEIFTDLGGQLSINDYYDHIYHLAGGGHMILHTNLVELKEGYLWVKSLNYDPLKGPLRVTTSNALVEHEIGEEIVSFDVYTGKTQVLAVNGSVELKNIRQEYYQLSLSEGQFSFISDEHEDGRPRRPTPIGYASYQKITGLFESIEPKQREKRSYTVKKAREVKTNESFEAALNQQKERQGAQGAQREIASVKAQDKSAGKSAGQITVLKLHEPQSAAEKERDLMNYYNSKVAELKPLSKPKKKWRPDYQKKSGVAVHVFGQQGPLQRESQQNKSKKRSSARLPASVGATAPKVDNSAFEGELLRQYKKQMRHDQEVNQLIDQLKSIDMDYKKDY